MDVPCHREGTLSVYACDVQFKFHGFADSSVLYPAFYKVQLYSTQITSDLCARARMTPPSCPPTGNGKQSFPDSGKLKKSGKLFDPEADTLP